MPFYYYNGALYSSEELMHYGVPGMKWGVRRYQDASGGFTKRGNRRYETKNAVRGLNRLSKDLTKTRYKKAVIDYKADKAYKRGNTKKAKKYAERSEALGKSISSGQQKASSIIKKAASSGVKIGSKEHMRYANTGKVVASSILLGPINAYSVARAVADTHRAHTSGNAEAGGMMQYKKYYREK